MKRVRSGATRLRHGNADRSSRFGQRSRVDLSKPRRSGIRFGVHYDNEAFGRFSEAIARFIGTARFLVFQSVFIGVWVLHNTLAPKDLRFDEYPMQFLTLILSLQAAYAAPLILLAQNRQADRDRIASERDRETAFRTQSDTEFLARELASIRIALSDVITGDELQKALEKAFEKVVDRTNEPRVDRA